MISVQVGIIGAGPAGLTLAHLLNAMGVSCVVLERHSRTYCENRIRAGVLEQGSVAILKELDLADRLYRERLVHKGVELGFDRKRHRLDFEALVGESVTVYGQHEVVKDLIEAAEFRSIPILFDVENVRPVDFEEGMQPRIHFDQNGATEMLRCDFIAGCDGFHGVCRSIMPAGSWTSFETSYPYAWLGILVAAAPSQNELVYSNTERGFALFSMRSPSVTRLYLQCDPNDDINNWSDDRIWSELFLRLEFRDGWRPNEGPILQKNITPMRSFVAEPMQFGKLFLAGDAAHIVPPTGAKGMNLALADVKVLSQAFRVFYKDGSLSALEEYSAICLRRVWQAQRFSWWMTSLLHRDPQGNPFEHRRQLAELRYLVTSQAAARSFAENYVGLPIPQPHST
jgi:p-hydroxybenzoate 3-monooxygenase